MSWTTKKTNHWITSQPKKKKTIGPTTSTQTGEMMRPIMTTPSDNYLRESCHFCGGPFHPATGGYRGGNRACGPCEKAWMKWVSAQTRRKWGKQRFYDHSHTSREKNMDGLVHCEDDVRKIMPDGTSQHSGKALCGIHLQDHEILCFPLPLDWEKQITCKMCIHALHSCMDQGNP